MDIQDLLKDHQLYHSEFQQDYFITVRSGGTEYGQYKQALRELSKRYRGLKELYAEKELLQIDIDELDEKTLEDKFEVKRNQIKRTQKIMTMEDLDKNIQDTEREFKRFYQQAVALKNNIGELTEEKRNRLDCEMWEFKIKEMAVLDYVSSGRLSKGTYELLASIPKKQRLKLASELRQGDTLIEWYESKEDMELKLPECDILKLLK